MPGERSEIQRVLVGFANILPCPHCEISKFKSLALPTSTATACDSYHLRLSFSYTIERERKFNVALQKTQHTRTDTIIG